MEDAGGLLPANNVAAKAKDGSILQLKKYKVILSIWPRLRNKYDCIMYHFFIEQKQFVNETKNMNFLVLFLIDGKNIPFQIASFVAFLTQ